MKHIQKIILSFLIALFAKPQLHAVADMYFSVPTGTGTYSGDNTATGKAYKTGAGTAVFSGANTFGQVEIDAGTVSVGSASNLGNPTATIFNGTSVILKITADMNTGALTMTTAGTVQVQSGVTATLNTAPSGSNTLSVTGTGAVAVTSALAASTTPIAVSGSGTTLRVSGSGVLSSGIAPSITSGSILQLGTSSGTVASGAVTNANIASGGILYIAPGVSAPSNVLTTPTIHNGAIIQLGANSTFAQAITVVA
ncbi:MAG: hypothetical protein NTW22_06955 [Proteobacteria bacterium]|jgi:autotransporter-associated beta strand protein|nr:hypothetical protein [Pseudomonadota bacterium]